MFWKYTNWMFFSFQNIFWQYLTNRKKSYDRFSTWGQGEVTKREVGGISSDPSKRHDLSVWNHIWGRSSYYCGKNFSLVHCYHCLYLCHYGQYYLWFVFFMWRFSFCCIFSTNSYYFLYTIFKYLWKCCCLYTILDIANWCGRTIVKI